jgi:subtilase family serine protease
MTTKSYVAMAVVFIILALCSPFSFPVLGADIGANHGLGSPILTTPVNESQLVTLVGNTRYEANARNDRGRVADNFALHHMLLQLKRSPEVESAFAKYIESLTSRSSPNYRQWMSAAEQGEKYGLAQQDIDVITGWLKSQGFTVGYVYPNRMVIDFSGTAGQIRKAFHTEIHNLNVHGAAHIANMSDPQIPAALASAVAGVVSLHDFKPHAHHKLRTQYSFSGCGADCYALVPADFQTIYNITPLINAGITGQGQTVALVEDTDTYSNDWANYQSTFGLTSYGGTMTTVHPNDAGNCTDPGTNGADIEADLDVEMVTAVAPSANAEVISCSDTTTTFGGLIAIQNILSAKNPPAVISMSYGECEAINGAASNHAFSAAFQTAAAAGVSVFVSAGDNGPSGCAPDFTGGDNYAYPGIGVTGWGESVYNVSVGGTDFEDLYNSLEGGAPQSTYWSTTNSSTYGSAKSYIPEIPWNDSCASFLVYNIEGYASPVGKKGFCNTSTGSEFLSSVAGGGGPSGCASGSGSADYAFIEDSNCKGYGKPSWQTNVFGVPKDGVRDVPDVSLFASNGIWGHYVVICASDKASGGSPCTGAPNTWAGVGGTSVSAPLMAAIQALVNQKWNTKVGNPNPTYYSIASVQYGPLGNSSCYSINESPTGSSCVFNDITQGDTSISCRDNGDVFAADCYKPDSYANGALSTQPIGSLSVVAAGSGYTSAPKCTLKRPSNFWPYYSPTGGIIYDGGVQAQCTATIDTKKGTVTSVTLNSNYGGQGYTGVPLCSLSGGGGTGAKCTAVITPTTGAPSYQPAFGATAGWDAATGLGSVNAYNLVFSSSWQ